MRIAKKNKIIVATFCAHSLTGVHSVRVTSLPLAFSFSLKLVSKGVRRLVAFGKEKKKYLLQGLIISVLINLLFSAVVSPATTF